MPLLISDDVTDARDFRDGQDAPGWPEASCANAARAAAAHGPAAALVDVSLGAGVDRRDILGGGWCEAEATATWTGDSEAGLHLPLAPGTRGCVLRLTAAPYRVAHKLGAQRVLVLAAGRLVGRMRVEAPGVADLAIPAAATLGRRVLTLTLVLPDARRPFELGDSEDRRLLALSVSRVELLADDGGWCAGGAVVAADRIPAPGPIALLQDPLGPATFIPAGFGVAGNAVAREEGAREPPDRVLLEGFESLGWNAEFGFVQRRMLAEPAGLLRWASAPLGAAVLAEALDAALFGVGDPAQIAVTAHDDAWVATDLRWGFRVETHVPLHSMGGEAVREREARVRTMLRARLLDTLREGRRILVYQERHPGEREAAGTLAEAIAAHGGCPLLWVSQGSEVAVRRRGRLLEATLPCLAPPDNLARVATEDWLAVCRAAWRLAAR